LHDEFFSTRIAKAKVCAPDVRDRVAMAAAQQFKERSTSARS
jgi:hypothetical protein